MEDIVRLTGNTERQVFQHARVAFAQMDTNTIRATANDHHDEWKAGKRPLPDYVESWALDRLRVAQVPRLKATKKSASRVGPIYDPTESLVEALDDA